MPSLKVKGLTPDEWTEAALQSLETESLLTMTHVVAAMFRRLRDELKRRGQWEAAIRPPNKPELPPNRVVHEGGTTPNQK